jgi:DNA topoisomerase-2
MAFGKARAAERKVWINAVDPAGVLAYDGRDVGIAQFVDMELSHFSRDDVSRSLPSAVDGLKKSQRKVVFAVKRQPRSVGETRVAQLAGYVGQVSGYHHGEASLQATIVGMAQRFVGCGHVQLLTDAGQFGSRIMGGKDSASARYIHTEATAAFRALFPEADEPLLRRQIDDDHNEVEPVHYLPVLPLALLNGALGIGTGYSTSVPCFSPELVAAAYLKRLDGDPAALRASLADPAPCYRGFRGTFHRSPENARRWHSLGVWTRSSPKTLEVEELPIGTWTHDYKEFLEEACAAGRHGLRRYDPRYTESDARFTLTFDSADALDALAADSDALETGLRLRSDKGLSLTNMHLIDARDRVRCYATPADIAEEHFAARIDGYRRRLDRQVHDTRAAVAVLQAKAAFVTAVIEGEIETRGVPIDALVQHCRDAGWPEAPTPSRPQHPYGYIVDMPVSALTAERRSALLSDVEEALRRLAALVATTPEAAWVAEIHEFMRHVPPDVPRDMAESDDTDAKTDTKTKTDRAKRARPGKAAAVAGSSKGGGCKAPRKATGKGK